MQLSSLIMLAALAAAISGCATRSYVDQRIAGLDSRLGQQDARIDSLTETSRDALQRATDAGKLAEGKFLYTVVFTHEGVSFDSNESALSDGAQSMLSELANDLKAKNENMYLEIQGHTDATGSAEYNQQLGLSRAQAVQRHLHAQGLALNRMATISYGEDAPVESNDTPRGRAMNRRVEVVVLN